MRILFQKIILFELLQQNNYKIDQKIQTQIFKAIEKDNNENAELIRSADLSKIINSKLIYLKRAWTKLKGGRGREIFRQKISNEQIILDIFFTHKRNSYEEDNLSSEIDLSNTEIFQNAEKIKVFSDHNINFEIKSKEYKFEEIIFRYGVFYSFQSKFDFILNEFYKIKLWAYFSKIFFNGSINVRITIKNKKHGLNRLLIISFSIISRTQPSRSFVLGLFNITCLDNNQIFECFDVVIKNILMKKIINFPDKNIPICYYIESDYKNLSIFLKSQLHDCLFCSLYSNNSKHLNKNDQKVQKDFSVCLDIYKMFMRITDSIFDYFLKENFIIDRINIKNSKIVQHKNLELVRQLIKEFDGKRTRAFNFIYKKNSFSYRDLIYYEKVYFIKNIEKLNDLDIDLDRLTKYKFLFVKFLSIFSKVSEKEIFDIGKEIAEWKEIFLFLFSKEKTTTYIHYFLSHYSDDYSKLFALGYFKKNENIFLNKLDMNISLIENSDLQLILNQFTNKEINL